MKRRKADVITASASAAILALVLTLVLYIAEREGWFCSGILKFRAPIGQAPTQILL